MGSGDESHPIEYKKGYLPLESQSEDVGAVILVGRVIVISVYKYFYVILLRRL